MAVLAKFPVSPEAPLLGELSSGARLKEEGATSGVSDLILLKSNRFYGGLCIEMKKPGARQSPAQKEWQKDAEANGAKYVVCKSLDEFMKVTIDYLNDV